MTAQRWWVRAYARWIMRLKSVQGQLNLFFTALTGVSIFSGALRYFGLPTWGIGVLLVAMLGFLAVYTYLYSEGGVWNQVRRDQRDVSANYADPKTRINTEHTVRGLAAAQQGRTLNAEEREALKAELDATFAEYRDGIDLGDS